MDGEGDSVMCRVMDNRWLRVLALLIGLLISLPWELHGLLTQSVKLAVAAAMLTYAVMPVVIGLAHKLGALDMPSERRVHAQPTPRIGGLAVLFSVNLTLLLNFNYSLELKGVCLSALIVGVLSLWDDIEELSASTKLFGQLVAIGVLLAFGVHIDFAPDTWWGDSLEYFVTAFWVIGITNAYNFLDGINGLAASLAMTVCILMAMLAWNTSQTYMLLLCLSMAGAALGFLPDNARYDEPARIFLGDVGSTYLGWMMASVAVMGDWSDDSAIKAYAAQLLIFSVMIFDMVYTTIARVWRGDVTGLRSWIEYVGRDHLHHRLMALGFSPSQTVTMIVAFSLLIGLAALALVKGNHITVFLLLAQSVVFYVILSALMIKSQNGR